MIFPFHGSFLSFEALAVHTADLPLRPAEGVHTEQFLSTS